MIGDDVGARLAHGRGIVARYWCERTESVPLVEGYLADPNGFGVRDPSLRTIEEVAAQRAVALLGESGLGKTTALNTHEQSLRARTGMIVRFDLADYGSEGLLVAEIFGDRRVERWRDGEGELHLLLDSFDQAKARIPTLGALLASQVRRLPVERLRLMIACRTADWPESLEADLGEIFDDEVGVYELLPLQREDVRVLADHAEVDGEAFLAAVERSGVTALASRPLTLKLLLGRFRESGGALPTSQAQLYEEGLGWLCDESNARRRDAGLAGRWTVEQRMAVGGRLAAITIFCGSPAFWTGALSGEVPKGDVLAERCADGVERTSRSSFEVTRDAVLEVLGTGLFSSRGPHRLGWTHQSYAEFLAARHLARRGLPEVQLRSLLTGAAGAVIPQLRSVAAWLVALAPGQAGFLLTGDPSLLVGTGIMAVDPALRAQAVEELLRRAGTGRHHRQTGQAYRELGHPGLGDQLRPLLTDRAAPLETRQLAVDLAEGGRASALAPVLAEIALDQTEPRELRVNAGYAVVRIGDDQARQMLRPLALGMAGDDPDDELKGVGLQAAWPAGLTVAEVLGALTPPKVGMLIGAYFQFLRLRFAQELEPPDLPEALAWAARQERESLGERRGNADAFAFRRLIDEIALLGWQQFDTEGIPGALAELVLARLRRQPGFYATTVGPDDRADFAIDDVKRRRLLTEVLNRMDESDSVFLLAGQSTGLVSRDDFGWLVERHGTTQNPTVRRALAELAGRMFDPERADHRDIVFALDRTGELYTEQFASWFEPIPLHSPLADQLRDLHSASATDGEEGLTDEELRGSIVGLLEAAEAGDTTAWWQFTRELTGQPDTIARAGSELDDDLTGLPGWQLLTSQEHERVVNVAERYLREASAGPDPWIDGGHTFSVPVLAGYKAAALLARRVPERLLALPASVWARWTPVLAYFPVTEARDEAEVKTRLLRLAYRHAPQVVLETLGKLLAKASTDNTGWAERDQVAACWDEPLEQALVGLLNEENLSDNVFGEVLDLLVERSSPPGRRLATGLLADDARRGTPGRAIRAAASLLHHERQRAWPTIWQLIQQDAAFGQELLLHLAGREDRSWAAALDAEAQVDLYIWLTKQFPPEEDLNVMEAHWVTDRERLGLWREQLLNELVSAGTAAAVEGVRRIAAAFPARPWLEQLVLDAEEAARRTAWSSMPPDALLAFLADPGKRVVRSAADLADLVVESLGRLQRQLQGELAQAWALWNEAVPGPDGKPKNRPEEESRLSGYVAVFLRSDLEGRGLVVNREVQVVQRKPKGLGERLDLHVEAFWRDEAGERYDILRVPIEVKGCWNEELFTAMESQLYGQYMAVLGASHGIYLVGWFDPRDWDEEDWRRATTVRDAKSVSSIEQRLKEQRAKLASAEGVTVRPFLLDISLKQEPSS